MQACGASADEGVNPMQGPTLRNLETCMAALDTAAESFVTAQQRYEFY